MKIILRKTIIAVVIIFILFMMNLPLVKSAGTLYEAKYWKSLGSGKVQCELCPFRCILGEGDRGNCRVRICSKGKLYTLVYGMSCAKNIDPIEKKPVFHMMPGTTAYSIATAGCNLRCKFCQNWQISQAKPEELGEVGYFSPRDVVRNALNSKCNSIAYTYSEPTVFYEYVLDTAKLAKKNGLRNILVSAGYINPEPLKELLPYFDVIKIDLKGFNEDFYSNVVNGRLKCVLDALLTIRKNSKVIIEIVNLVVPGLNDNLEEVKKMSRWIKENLGAETPLFFSRFYPNYQLRNLPSTPVLTLEKCRDIAIKEGLNFVYLGNVPGHEGESTYCSKCKKILIKRNGYTVLENNLKHNKCKFCGKEIPGIWQ